jgi:RimJ/RimL family protein N-acetyltransferase
MSVEQSEKASVVGKVAEKVFKIPDVNLAMDEDIFDERMPYPNPNQSKVETKELVNVTIRQFTPEDTDVVHDFLVNSVANHGPFRYAVRELIEDKEKISHYLSAWDFDKPGELDRYNNLHHIFFGTWVDSKLVAASICAIQIKEGTIEIGGFVAPGLRGRGIGEMTGLKIMDSLRNIPYYKKHIKKFVFETQKGNVEAIQLARKVGVRVVKEDENGIVLEFDF